MDPSGSVVPSAKLCMTTMNGESCFCISIVKPSDVAREVMALQGMMAPSYGPGLLTCTAVVDAAAAAASLIEEEEEEDGSSEEESADGGGGGGAPGFIFIGGGGGGGASHCM